MRHFFRMVVSFSFKKQKSFILDEFIRMTGFNRSYASRALRINEKDPVKSKIIRSGRRRQYDAEVHKVLVKIWEILDFINSKRLAAI